MFVYLTGLGVLGFSEWVTSAPPVNLSPRVCPVLCLPPVATSCAQLFPNSCKPLLHLQIVVLPDNSAQVR